ncbi:MAG: glutathione S-transferase family protein [Gammaproteobacteria bacterium]|nr:glutathione S-transferase family protein [Gammaproteobacteria bacterium]
MGLLVNGKWQDRWYDTSKWGGRFERQAASFRHWITPDGSPGESGAGGFPAAAGRYHLYVSLACPWASRTLVLRKLKGLEDAISVSSVKPHMLENGWEFGRAGSEDASLADPLYCRRFLHEIYTLAEPEYTGRVTVPVLWDKEQEAIVNNESAEIIRMLNDAFGDFAAHGTDYYPAALRGEIDRINDVVYRNVNNGVYRCGFATSQEAYEEGFDALFATLDELDARLGRQRYLVGSRLTEADWRLFTTLVRFDVVYYGHFKANLHRVADYPNLSNYLRDLYQHDGVAATVDFGHIKQHYYYSHGNINPTRVVPKGPAQDLDAPHDRGRF